MAKKMPTVKITNVKIVSIIFIGLLPIFAICPTSSCALSIVGDMGAPTEGIGNFSGEFSYNNSTSILTVSLTNTSDPSNGGFITAFAFNNPFNVITSVALTDVTLSYIVTSPFSSLGLTDDGIGAGPFGYFDMGASLSDKFLGGGSANDGIGVGENGIFELTLDGSGFNEMDFVDALSQGDNRSSWFLVRFRGFIEEDPGSDMVPGIIPEPTSLLLLGSGLLGMAGIRINRRKNRGIRGPKTGSC